MDSPESARITTTLEWLEKSQHENTARFEQLDEKLELLLSKLHDHESKQRDVEDAVLSVQAELERIAVVSELAHQLSERQERLAQDFLEFQQRFERAGRAQQVDSERIQTDLNEITQRINDLGQETELLNARLGPLIESVRREHEIRIEFGQKLDHLREQDELLAGRAHLVNELAKRNEQELELLFQEIEPLRKQDEVTMGRLQILGDHIRQVQEQVDTIPGIEQGLKELAERFQVHRIEQQRVQTGIDALRADLDQRLVQIDEQTRQIKLIEDRRQQTIDHISAVRVEVRQHVQEMQAMMLDWQRMVEQHRVATIAELERQLREIKQRSIRLAQGSLE